MSIVHTGIRHPGSVMKNVIPIVMAGVIGIYGLIVGVILAQAIDTPTNDRANVYSIYTGLAHLSAGLCCGISGLAAGLCIGIVGDYGIRAVGYRASQITLFPAMNATEAAGYSTIPEGEQDNAAGGGGGNAGGGDDVGGSDDQNKLFVGMLIMLIFSEALALYGMIIALIVSQNTYSC
jgi:V-type H+-transporting ATPase 16kDa proteolipid subunit